MIDVNVLLNTSWELNGTTKDTITLALVCQLNYVFEGQVLRTLDHVHACTRQIDVSKR